MKDIDFILDLIQARAFHHSSCAYTTQNEEDWEEERPLCHARSAALIALATEIRASVRPKPCSQAAPVLPKSTRQWALATEMGGQMNLTFHDDEASASKAKDQFCSDYKLMDDWDAHAVCAIKEVDIPARRSGFSREIDGRYALMVKVDGQIAVSIHETLKDLRSTLAEFKRIHGADEIWAGYHAILVPRSISCPDATT